MKNIEDLKILVVGDIMLDKYVVGKVERISPEAPVPIVKAYDEYSTLGGCGNVVRNLREIGPTVYCACSIANDDAGLQVLDQLDSIGAIPLLTWQSRKTTIKERVIADPRKVQMLRVDREIIDPILSEPIIEEFKIHKIDEKNYFDMIVVSDYAKGMITGDLMGYLRSLKTDIIIDPKPQNTRYYGRPLMITPNQKEWEEMQMKHSVVPEFILVTKGQLGMTLIDNRQASGRYEIPADPVEVYNVSGAGDTVVSVMAVCLALNIPPEHSARIANECAGFVVTQPGTTVVPKNKFMKTLELHTFSLDI